MCVCERVFTIRRSTANDVSSNIEIECEVIRTNRHDVVRARQRIESGARYTLSTPAACQELFKTLPK